MPLTTVEVVPTAVQAAATPIAVVVEVREAAGAGVQATALRAPVPTGTVPNVQVAPPSAVEAMPPTAWAESTLSDVVAQQCRLSVHDRDVAEEAGAGSAPPTTQAPPGPVGASVVTWAPTVPRAVHPAVWRQETAVTSVVPAGTAWVVQTEPPSVVVRMAPGPTPVPPA